MKCMDCSKHGMVWCAIGETILRSELCCQKSGDRIVIAGASKPVMAATEEPEWCPLTKEAEYDAHETFEAGNPTKAQP